MRPRLIAPALYVPYLPFGLNLWLISPPRLQSIQSACGLLITTEWKARKGGSEWSGPCPICKPKSNKGNFSFDEGGKFHCFSCGAKGRGARDLVKAIKACGFREAVNSLAEFHATSVVRTERRIPPRQSEAAEASETPPFKGVYAEATKASRPEPAELHQVGSPQETLENSPFKSTYEKYRVESAWPRARGFTPETLDRFEVFQ